MDATPTEPPEDKALQDHTFGRKVARQADDAEQRAAEGCPPAPGDDEEREAEPHAGGKA